MSKTDYLSIIKKAWNITWDNKFLWWFGFLLALGNGGFNFNAPINLSGKKENTEKISQLFSNFISRYWELAVIGLVVFAALMIAVIILKIISRGGLIKSVSDISSGKKTDFKAGFLEGKKYFWRIFLLSLLINFFVIAASILLIIPVVFLFFLKATVWAVILGILAAAIIIILGILASFLRNYGYIYLVLSEINVMLSLETAFQLFRKNVRPSLIFALLILAISVIFGFAIIFALIIPGLIFFLIGLIMNLVFAKIGIYVTISLGILLLAALLLFLQSVFETFRQTAWVLFFKEIASVKDEEIVKEEEVVKAAKVLDAGEA